MTFIKKSFFYLFLILLPANSLITYTGAQLLMWQWQTN